MSEQEQKKPRKPRTSKKKNVIAKFKFNQQ